jgi:uncharacterized protein YdeI (YjbR/CyaY-like superfamily)
MSTKDPEVEAFFDRAGAWQAELRKLRSILLACGLDEALRWGKPCYRLEGRNLAILQPFKEHCALMFFRGERLEDTHGLLRRPGKDSRTARRLEFTSSRGIVKSVVEGYVRQAIAVERSGGSPPPGPTPEPQLPAELARILAGNRELAQAFRALTPGRRRGYLLHFSKAKQAATRVARIERCAPQILAGQGLHDR